MEWLCYQLWSKTTASAPVFSFSIADTIILREGLPQTWYFSTKEGYILKKNYQNVRLPKINKSFCKKNGINGSTAELPAMNTYLYKPQRNTETGEERLALRIGPVAGKDLMPYLRASVANRVEGGRPHILQAFVPPRTLKNAVIRVCWTQSNMQIVKITNKLAIVDERYSLLTRTVSCEDQDEGLYTEQKLMPNQGQVYERLLRSMLEIHNHIKKSSDVLVTGGNFYFKLNDSERPILLLATQIKTERPILVLNASINVALVATETRIQPKPKKSGAAAVQLPSGEMSE